jgi:hypothetical protein
MATAAAIDRIAFSGVTHRSELVEAGQEPTRVRAAVDREVHAGAMLARIGREEDDGVVCHYSAHRHAAFR